jgi:hypothetical protein
MITQVEKEYRSDEGLAILMGKLKVDGIKIGKSNVIHLCPANSLIQVRKWTAHSLVSPMLVCRGED